MRQLLAAVSSFLIVVPFARAGGAVPLGVVTMAERAQLGSLRASTGDSVFGGDILSTDDVGVLRVRAGAAQFLLFAGSSVAVMPTSTGIRAILRRGALALASANSGAIEVQASEARIRQHGDGLVQAQVTLVNPRELIVTTRRGTLEISVDDETQIIPEAASYRVLMEQPEFQGPQGVGGKSGAKPPGRNPKKKRMLLIWVGVAAGGAAGAGIWLLHQTPESPDRP